MPPDLADPQAQNVQISRVDDTCFRGGVGFRGPFYRENRFNLWFRRVEMHTLSQRRQACFAPTADPPDSIPPTGQAVTKL
jgi:hypothetical protein